MVSASSSFDSVLAGVAREKSGNLKTSVIFSLTRDAHSAFVVCAIVLELQINRGKSLS